MKKKLNREYKINIDPMPDKLQRIIPGIHLFFLKVVSQVGMPDDILALAKFYLPFQ